MESSWRRSLTRRSTAGRGGGEAALAMNRRQQSNATALSSSLMTSMTRRRPGQLFFFFYITNIIESIATQWQLCIRGGCKEECSLWRTKKFLIHLYLLFSLSLGADEYNVGAICHSSRINAVKAVMGSARVMHLLLPARIYWRHGPWCLIRLSSYTRRARSFSYSS